MKISLPEDQHNLLVISQDSDFHKKAAESAQFCAPELRLHLIHASYEESSKHPHELFILVDIAGGDPSKIKFLENLFSQRLDSKIICAGNNLSVDLVLHLVKLGFQHFLKLPLNPEEFKSSLISLLAHPSSQEGKESLPKKGKVITVYSPKGGSGVTLLSINLAIALAKSGKRDQVAICDLAPQVGDVHTYLNLNTKYTLRDLLDNSDRLDHSLMEGVLASHESGIRVLSSVALDQEPLSINSIHDWQLTLHFLKQNCDIVVIDSAHTDENLLHYTFSQSDMILLMGNLDVPSLKGMLFGINKLSRLRIESEKIKIVINRFNAKNQLDIKEFLKSANHPVACKLSNNYNACIESVNAGRPLNLHFASSDVAKQIKEFADRLRREMGFSLGLSPVSQTQDSSADSSGSKKSLWRWGQ